MVLKIAPEFYEFDLWKNCCGTSLKLFFIFFIWSPLVRRHLFLTTFYGIYFSHHNTHISHYKSCWNFSVGSYSTLLARAPPVVFELLRKSFWGRTGFKPMMVESCNLWSKRSTSKPPRLIGETLFQFWIIH